MAEWFRNKIVRLSETNDEESKKEILTEMSIKLHGLRTSELDEITTNLDLTGFFAQLISNDRRLVEEMCKVLKVITEALEPGEVHQRYPSELRRLLIHSESSVKILALGELLRQAEREDKLGELLRDVDLIKMTIERIGDDELNVANLAMKVTKKIGAYPQGFAILYSGIPLRALARLLEKNDTASFRVYEVVVAIAKTSKKAFEASGNSGFLDSLINVLNNNDILLNLNALEILSDLALSDDGLTYLEDRDVLGRLADKIARSSECPLSNLIIPGLMKFFGGLARSRPHEIFTKYSSVVTALFKIIEGEDPTFLTNALDTLGLVATSVEGKYALESLGDAMPRSIEKIAEIVQKMPTELRLRGLDNLSFILKVDDHRSDNRILSLTKSWFDRLGDDPLGIIVGLCKQPFDDIRRSSLEVLATISLQNWGQEYIANYPGLVEFLLDRNAESFKSTKEVKYRIVKNLTESETDIFDPETFEKLKNFVRDGPFHVDAEAEITTEGES